MFLDYHRPEPRLAMFHKPVPVSCAVAILLPMFYVLITGMTVGDILTATWLHNMMSLAGALALKMIFILPLPLVGGILAVRALWVIWRQPRFVGMWLAGLSLLLNIWWFCGILWKLHLCYGGYYKWI
ncbi:MAG: hypothetical protein WCI73_05370 [Phycisphaerae bacterium]